MYSKKLRFSCPCGQQGEEGGGGRGREKEKEEYYCYHENPGTFVTGRSFFGGKKKKLEESKVKERHDIDRRVDGPIVVFNWHAVPFTLES